MANKKNRDLVFWRGMTSRAKQAIAEAAVQVIDEFESRCKDEVITLDDYVLLNNATALISAIAKDMEQHTYPEHHSNSPLDFKDMNNLKALDDAYNTMINKNRQPPNNEKPDNNTT